MTVHPTTSVAPRMGVALTTPAAAPTAVQPLTADVLRAVQRALDTVGMDIAKRLPAGKSCCFSPVSVLAVSGMILQALDHREQAAFLAKCKLEQYQPETVLRAIAESVNSLACSTPTANVRVANAIVMRETVQMEYLQAFQAHFKGSVFPSGTNATETVNRWVAANTGNMIEQLLAPGSADNAMCVLLNAIAFEAKWQTMFDQAKPGLFEVAGKKVPVMMMSKTMPFRLFEADDCSLIEIPYKAHPEHRHSFVIMLPKRGQELQRLLDNLTPEMLSSMRSRAKEVNTKISMPKLLINYKMDNLLSILSEIGLPVDKVLSGLASDARLEKIVSEVKVEVDEDGTKGAAATAAIVYRSMGPMPLMVDRPFACFVVDGEKVLFQGTIVDESFLVSEEKHCQLLDKTSKPKIELLQTAQAKELIENNRDMKLLMQYLPNHVKAASPTVTLHTISGTRFTLVNYTDVQIGIKEDKEHPTAPFLFTFNTKPVQLGYTPDDCQVLFYQNEVPGHITTLSKDEGQMKESDIMRLRWNLQTGSYQQLPLA